MKIILLDLFKQDYKKLSSGIQKQIDKKILFLITNFHYPSLKVKKIQGTKNIWEGRITRDVRFTFQVIENNYILRRVGKHNETLKRS